jgi:hypothetical protein
MDMFTWIRRYRERKLAQQQEQEKVKERMRILHEQQLERCKMGDHDWEYTYEIQGDGDPNVEGYILITTSTCRVCHQSETEIEPYEKDNE